MKYTLIDLAFDPARHPRGPGGRFISTHDAAGEGIMRPLGGHAADAYLEATGQKASANPAIRAFKELPAPERDQHRKEVREGFGVTEHRLMNKTDHELHTLASKGHDRETQRAAKGEIALRLIARQKIDALHRANVEDRYNKIGGDKAGLGRGASLPGGHLSGIEREPFKETASSLVVQHKKLYKALGSISPKLSDAVARMLSNLANHERVKKAKSLHIKGKEIGKEKLLEDVYHGIPAALATAAVSAALGPGILDAAGGFLALVAHAFGG